MLFSTDSSRLHKLTDVKDHDSFLDHVPMQVIFKFSAFQVCVFVCLSMSLFVFLPPPPRSLSVICLGVSRPSDGLHSICIASKKALSAYKEEYSISIATTKEERSALCARPAPYVCTHALLLMCAHKSKHTSCKIGKL